MPYGRHSAIKKVEHSWDTKVVRAKCKRKALRKENLEVIAPELKIIQNEQSLVRFFCEKTKIVVDDQAFLVNNIAMIMAQIAAQGAHAVIVVPGVTEFHIKFVALENGRGKLRIGRWRMSVDYQAG